MPKVSIITPCYNGEKFIGDCIESLLAQKFQDWEHVVVDDGSTDRSAEIIASYALRDSRVKPLFQKNMGASNARNNGFIASCKDSVYLLFLDADDCFEPLMLERMTLYMNEHPEVGLARSGFISVDENNQRKNFPEKEGRYAPSGLWVRRIPEEEPDTPFASLFTLCPVIPSISLIRRSVYERCPGWDEHFGGQMREETDLFLWIALMSKIHYLTEPLVRRRRHSGQYTETHKHEFDPLTIKLYQKWREARRCLNPEQRRIVNEAFRFRNGRLEPFLAFERAAVCMRQGNILKGIRFYLGGLRRYLVSFFSIMDKS